MDDFTVAWTQDVIVTLEGRVYRGDPITHLQAILELRGGLAVLGFPAVAGDQGDAGPPGAPVRVQGTVANAAARPTGLNSTTDVGKAWFTASDFKLNVWAGTGWVASPSLRGADGPAASINAAGDFDASGGVPTTGAYIAFNGTKWAPFVPPELTLKHEPTSPFVVPNDATNMVPVPMVTPVTSAGGALAPVWGGAANPTRAIAKLAGRYAVFGRDTFPIDSGGSRACGIRRNGTAATVPAAGSADVWLGDSCQASNNVYTSVSVYAEVQFAVDQWVELLAACSRAGGLALTSGVHDTHLSMRYIRP